MNKVKTKFKRYLLGFMIGLFLCSCSVYAVDTYHVSTAASAIQMVEKNQYIVPIYIRNNQGIMGFRIDLNYDTQNVKIQSVTKGLVTAKGNFSSNVALEQNNEVVSVLWNTTQNATVNGSIMYLGVKVLKPEVETVNIEVNYSQPDTFNEQWKDVVLQCDSISFKPQQIVDGSNESKDDDMKELIQSNEEMQYQSQAEQSISMSQKNSVISEDQIKGALVRTLKKYKAASISNIPEKEEKKFWSDVEDDLQKNEHVRKSQLKKVDLPRIADMITITNEDFENYSLEEDAEVKVNKGIFVAVGITVLLVVVVLCGKRRKNSEKE